MKQLLVLAAYASLTPAACMTTTDMSGIPELIVTERGGFIPEGAGYDNSNGIEYHPAGYWQATD
jgi:hypothetical protein